MEHFKTFTYTHPFFTSDYCFQAVGPGRAPASIHGVADMIGHPSLLRRGYYMKKAERDMRAHLMTRNAWSFEDLTGALREMIVHQNGYFANFRRQPDPQPFGYCLCFAGAVGRRLRLFWLGDCRAYLVRRGRTDTGDITYEVQCLTEDQNQLNQFLFEQKEVTLFKQELVDLSKHLHCYLGQKDDEFVQAILDLEDITIQLDPGECLMFMTDGLYMPLIRAMLDATQFKLTWKDLYLEQWLANFFARHESRLPKDSADPWDGAFQSLIDHTHDLLRKYPRYRDDIAVMALRFD